MYSSNTDISLNSAVNTINCKNNIIKSSLPICYTGGIVDRNIQKFTTFTIDFANTAIIHNNATIVSYTPKNINKNSKVIIQCFFNAYSSYLNNTNTSGNDFFDIILYQKGNTINTELDRTYMYFYGYLNNGAAYFGGGSRRQIRPLIGEINIPINTNSTINFSLFLSNGALPSFAASGNNDIPGVNNVTFTFTQVIIN